MFCVLRGNIGHERVFGAVLLGKHGIDHHGRGHPAGAISWAVLLPPHVVTESSACAEQGKMQIFKLHEGCSWMLSYTPVVAWTCPRDLPARRSLCYIWVTFARDETSPNYTPCASRAQQPWPHPTGLISAPNGAWQAGRPLQGLSSLPGGWAGITPGCGSRAGRAISQGADEQSPARTLGLPAEQAGLLLWRCLSEFLQEYFLLHSLP